MKSIPRVCCSLWLLGCAVVFSGCSQLNLNKKISWPWEGYFPGRPSKVTAIWSEVMAYYADQEPQRGFGARLFFNDDKSDDPLKVEGMLTVYAFDETNRDPNNVKPDRKYVFTKEQFAKHYTKGKIGPSYNVFIPWDDAGGPEKQVSLIVRFVPDKGEVIVSDQVKQLLHGSAMQAAQNQKPATGMMPANSPAGRDLRGAVAAAVASMQGGAQAGNVRAASLEQPLAGNAGSTDNSTRRMNTTTIEIPQKFTRPVPVSQQLPRPQIPQGISPQAVAAALNATRQGGQTGGAAGAVSQINQTPALPKPVIADSTNQNPLNQTLPQAHSSLSRPRALGEPIAQLPRDRGMMPQTPAVLPSRPQLPPSQGTGFEPQPLPNAQLGQP
jgi:hypothetical protein